MESSVESYHANFINSQNQNYDCPVCYFIANPNILKNAVCMKCDEHSSTWVCIFCGHVGCNAKGHAWQHYKETTHNLAMGIKNCAIWNFITKHMLHKLNGTAKQLDELKSCAEKVDENECSCLICQHMRKIRKFGKKSSCMKCEITQEEGLWICLDCSFIGCGKMFKRHAIEHYTKTNHDRVMQLSNSSIWDYKEQKFVHRLLDKSPAKKELVYQPNVQLEERNEKRMDSLEHKWQELSKLSDISTKINSIEEHLVRLTSEKKILNAKLLEHDFKFNKLLKKSSVTNHTTTLNDRQWCDLNLAEFFETNENEIYKDEPIINYPSTIHRPKIVTSNICYIMIIGFVIYHTLMLIVEKLFQGLFVLSN